MTKILMEIERGTRYESIKEVIMLQLLAQQEQLDNK